MELNSSFQPYSPSLYGINNLPAGLGPDGHQPTKLEEGAKALEAHFAYIMLKTMDQSSEGGGLLGEKNQGMSHFKDVFFMHMAEKMVEHREIGFKQALVNTYDKQS